MRLTFLIYAGVALTASSQAAQAATFTFNQDPFAGTNVLNTAGRQIVGGEDFISFNIAQDVFSLDAAIFNTTASVNFVNAAAGGIPPTDVNIIVLETFDNDNNPLTPFGAGQAADLIAGRITAPGAGFFIYFNQSLDLPRLVYSTDLSSSGADLKILARMLNLNGPSGMNMLPSFTAANFSVTSAAPEPSTVSMLLGTGLIGLTLWRRRRRRVQGSLNADLRVGKQQS